ncbi:MAG: matrixin family metalloprotease [Myxococcales bacterium]|nr:matrixin family metalloprotease [Myxococcales bacterium]
MIGRLAVLTCLAAAGAARAHEPLRAPEPVAWPADAWPLPLGDGPLPWRAAAARWTAVAPLGFRPVADPGLAPDGTIAFARVDDAPRWQALVGDDSVLAFTLVEAEGEALLDADVVLNAAHYQFGAGPRAWDEGSVLAHELGHAIGLGHACGDALPCADLADDDPRVGALMSPRLEPGERREPGPDDVAGVQAHVRFAGPIDRPTDADVTPAPPGWVARDGLALARLWAAGAPVGEALVPVGDGPWQVELWTPAGQGHVTGPLAPPPAPSGPAAGGEGCQAAPGSALFFVFLTGWPRRRR